MNALFPGRVLKNSRGRRAAGLLALTALMLPFAAAAASPSPAVSAPPQQERTSFLGPEEGETLTSWTERWLDCSAKRASGFSARS